MQEEHHVFRLPTAVKVHAQVHRTDYI